MINFLKAMFRGPAIKIFTRKKSSFVVTVYMYMHKNICFFFSYVLSPPPVKLFEVIETDKTLYLIMEYASGGKKFIFVALPSPSLLEEDTATLPRWVMLKVSLTSRLVTHSDGNQKSQLVPALELLLSVSLLAFFIDNIQVFGFFYCRTIPIT